MKILRKIWKGTCPVFPFFLALGLTLSSQLLSSGSFYFFYFLYAFLGVILVFNYQQAIEKASLEQDIDKKEELVPVLNGLQLFMYLYAGITWLVFSLTASTIYLIITLYLWYYSKNFFLRGWLNNKLLFKPFLKNIIFLLVVLFPYSLIKETIEDSFVPFFYGFLIFLAFFYNYFSHQLEPLMRLKHPTFVQYYGFRRLFYVLSIILFLSALCTYSLNLQFYLWPLQIALFLSLCFLFLNSERYKLVEKCSEISLSFHCWIIVIVYILNLFSDTKF